MTNVLMLSLDGSIADSSASAGDSHDRHLRYGAELDRQSPGSKLLIIAPSRTFRSAPAWISSNVLFASISRSMLPRRTWQFWRRGIALFRTLPYHLITTQTPFDDGFVGYALARRYRVPFVPQIRGDIFSTGWRWGRFPVQAFASWVGTAVLRRADHIQVVSQHLKRVLTTRRFSEDRISVLPSAITFVPLFVRSDAERRSIRNNLHVGDAEICCLFVGEFGAAKNIPFLIDLMDDVTATHRTVTFVLVGDGPERRRIECWRHAHPDRAARVRLTGKLPYGRVRQWYAAADVFVLTSRYEGFARVLREAATSGLPIVTTDVSGAEEVVLHGVSGYIMPQGDREEFCSKFRELIGDPALRQQFGQRARAHALGAFSSDRIVRERVRLWLSIATSRYEPSAVQ